MRETRTITYVSGGARTEFASPGPDDGLTNSMEPGPSLEANSCSTTQDIPSNLRDSNVHSRVQNSPPLVSILSQINPVLIPILFLWDLF
jgi:hypothetical protein